MIVQSLVRYYDILAGDRTVEISRWGYSPAKVSFALVISDAGELTNIIDLRTDGKKKQPVIMDVPYQKSRTVSIVPYFLCDNSKYVFGIESINLEEKKEESEYLRTLESASNELIVVSKRSQKCFEQFRLLQRSILGEMNTPKVISYLHFLDHWKPEESLQHPKVAEYKKEILAGAFFIFEVEGEFLHKYPDIRKTWEQKCDNLSPDETPLVSQCLVTGQSGFIAKTHQPIKGVKNAHTKGATLISFNDPAFESYNKEQSYNAPVSESAMFKYTTALNYLLEPDSKNRIQIGDTTTVFWAETEKKSCENLVHYLFDPVDDEAESDANSAGIARQQDRSTRQLVSDILKKVKTGKYLEEKDLGVDPETTNFYILGLSPNKARLAVRFWHQDNFGNFITQLARHHLDMEIERDDRVPQFISIYWLLKQTVPKGSKEFAASPMLGGLLMRSILENTPYPVPMYNAILNRVKVERSINYTRAGFIKACLIRLARTRGNHEEDLITVSLNEKNPNVSYRLGRLFAILESAQKSANPTIKRTIRDSYFASASSTPAVVYPILLKLNQHHLSKINSEKPGLGVNISKSMDDVISSIDRFPVNLSLEEQGMFMLGYYHQHESFFRKGDDTLERGKEELKQ